MLEAVVRSATVAAGVAQRARIVFGRGRGDQCRSNVSATHRNGTVPAPVSGSVPLSGSDQVTMIVFYLIRHHGGLTRPRIRSSRRYPRSSSAFYRPPAKTMGRDVATLSSLAPHMSIWPRKCLSVGRHQEDGRASSQVPRPWVPASICPVGPTARSHTVTFGSPCPSRCQRG